jgi:TP901 family phage tail tape measure protein/lambda family phage tail tape measure protein
MPDPTDLTLGVLFRAREDPNFKRITRRLHTIVTGFQQGMHKVDVAAKKAEQSMRRMETASRRAERGLKDTGQAAGFTGKQIGKVHGGIQRLIAAFKVVAVYTVAGRLFSGFQAALRQGWEEIVNFDQALANLKAITGATDQQIQSMRETLKETAMRTKFSTTEIAEGMVLLGQAGLNAGESMAAIDAVADLAAGTLSDFKNVSDLVTTSLRAFNLDATETRRVADVMANAVNKSKLTIDKLRTAFNYVGAGAAQAGLSIEHTAASMMVLANNGMRASTIGTGLRQVLARLLSPNAKIKQAMDAYGLSLDKSTGKTEWFQKQVGKLATVIYDFEKDTVNMSKAYELFGLRGAQAAAILVKSYMDLDGTWATMLDKVKEIGTANKMMEDQAEGLGFKIKNLADSFGVLSINLGEAGFTAGVEAAVDALRVLVQFLARNVNTWFGTFTATLIGTAGALYTVRLAILAVRQAMQFAGTGLKKFFLNPIGLAIIAVSTLIAVIYASTKALQRKRDAMNEAADKTLAFTGNLQSFVRELDKVKEGSDEYNTILDRMKQQYKELAPMIDKLRGNYAELRAEIAKLTEEGRKESIQAKSKLLATDVDVQGALFAYQKMLKQREALAGHGAVPDTLEQFLGKTPEVQKKIREYVQMVGETFIQQMREGKTREQIEAQMGRTTGPFGFLSGLSYFPEAVKTIYTDVMAIVDRYEEQLAAQAEARRKAMMETIDALPPEWRKLEQHLFDTRQWLKYLAFLKAVAKAQKEWVAQESTFRAVTEKKFGKDTLAREKAVNELKLQHYKAHLAKYLDAGSKANNQLIKDSREVQKWYVESFGTGMDVAFYKLDQKYFKLKKQIEALETDETTRKEYLSSMWAAYYAELQKMIDDGQFPGTLFPKGYIEARLAQLKALSGAGGKATMPTRSTQSERDRLNQEEWIERQKEIDKLSDEWAAKERKRLAAEKGEATEAAYRRGEVSAQEYFDSLRVMYVNDLITWKEYQDKMRREQNTTWQNFKEGWQDFFGQMETNAEFIYRFAQELPEKLGTGFADMWGDFLTGTKDAKEAFSDFARDMLRWIAELLAKRAMMQMLGGIGGMFGGGTPYVPAAHGGGMYGEFKGRKKWPGFGVKLHGGLMPDEFPAVLKKNEGVFTPKQMAALGAAIKGGTEINVPVNVRGNSADMMQRYLPGEIEETVLKVMRKYS